VHFELSKNQKPNESIRDIIIKTMKEQKPETTSQLLGFIQKTTNLSEKEIINLLNQLESEDKIHFNMKQEKTFISFRTYLFSFESAWYWTIIAVALVTTLTVFTIPQDWYPLKALFQKKVPIKTSSESFDTIERVVLSIGMSIALTPIVGLILYYTPLGIGLTPITLSLLALTAVFATAAVTREYLAKVTTIQQTY
jgi:hypothetical protein